jgi:hypothetical protein
MDRRKLRGTATLSAAGEVLLMGRAGLEPATSGLSSRATVPGTPLVERNPGDPS